MKDVRIKRKSVLLNFEVPDPTLEVEPGQEKTVLQLYNDFVLGRLDPRDLGGGSYDSPEGVITEEIDPFNSFGMTLEQADALRQTSQREVARARKEQAKKTVANAGSDAMQPGQGTKKDSPTTHEPPKEGE